MAAVGDSEKVMVGWIDRAGELVVPVEWELNEDGRELGRPNWEFNEFGLVRVVRDRQFGWINKAGEIVVPPEWDDAAPFDSHGRARVTKGWDNGWIDPEGNLVIPARWTRGPGFFSDFLKTEAVEEMIGGRDFDDAGMAIVRVDQKFGWINTEGEVVIVPEWDSAAPFDAGGLAAVAKGRLKGWIDRSGKLIVPLEWTQIYDFDANDRTRVFKSPNWALINRSGKILTQLRWDKIREPDAAGVMLSRQGDLWGWISPDGVEVPAQWDAVRAFNAGGTTTVRSGGKWSWVDLAGQRLNQTEWHSATNYDQEGMALVKLEDHWGWVDRSGDVVVDLEWDDAEEFDSGGLAMVERDGKYGWINREGDIVIPLEWDYARPFDSYGKHLFPDLLNSGLTLVGKGGERGLIDRNGKIKLWPADPYHTGSTCGADGVIMSDSENGMTLYNRHSGEVVHFEDVVTRFDGNGNAWVYKDGMISKLINSRGEPLIEFLEEGWYAVTPPIDRADLTVPSIYPDRFVANLGFHELDDDFPKDWFDFDCYVVRREAEVQWTRRYYLKFINWFRKNPAPTPTQETRCRCYDKNGKLIWSNTGMRYETKCMAIFAVAVVVAFLAKPFGVSRTGKS